MRLKKILKWISYLLGSYCASIFSQTIVIQGNVVINKPTVYDNVTLDLTHGSLTLTNEASLEIKDSVIESVVTPENPFAIRVISGHFSFRSNHVMVSSDQIAALPESPAKYYALHIVHGLSEVSDNQFYIDKLFTVGLLTTEKQPLANFKFVHNSVEKFHGGVILINTQHASVLNNYFYKVSGGNIYFSASQSASVKNNQILFPGNGHLGDAVDLMNSSDITLDHNYIFSGSCYGVVILASQNIYLFKNNIVSGITYGIYINNAIQNLLNNNYLFSLENSNAMLPASNKHLVIKDNYLAQNRFGLSARSVDDLTVSHNYFIQSFIDDATRTFWTNNDILLNDVTGLSWQDNFYKEAFTQNEKGSNKYSFKFYNFPQQGGVNFNKV